MGCIPALEDPLPGRSLDYPCSTASCPTAQQDSRPPAHWTEAQQDWGLVCGGLRDEVTPAPPHLGLWHRRTATRACPAPPQDRSPTPPRPEYSTGGPQSRRSTDSTTEDPRPSAPWTKAREDPASPPRGLSHRKTPSPTVPETLTREDFCPLLPRTTARQEPHSSEVLTVATVDPRPGMP
nr:wiskott-Aldrich syndrome protein homolog 1 [Macaca nemestrina]